MTASRRISGLLVAVVLSGLAACGGTSSSGTDVAAPEPSSTTGVQATQQPADPGQAASSSENPSTEADSAVPASAWQSAPFLAVDGSTKRVADYLGRPVYVEFFATWCPSCLYQLRNVAAAADTGPDAVFLALSVETDVDIADIAKYQSTAGFDAIEFGLMTPEMLGSVVDDLGTTVINPPATPHVIVDSTGSAGPLYTGKSDAAAIISALASVG